MYYMDCGNYSGLFEVIAGEGLEPRLITHGVWIV